MVRRGCECFALTCTFILVTAVAPAADEDPLAAPTAPESTTPIPPDVAAPPSALAPAPTAAPVEPDPRVADVDLELDEIDSLVHDAHFRSALSVAASTRALLDELEPGVAVDERVVRLEILAATAQLALGRSADARVSLAHAVRIDPDLELDEGTTSPKVVRALDAVRDRPARSPWDEDGAP